MSANTELTRDLDSALVSTGHTAPRGRWRRFGTMFRYFAGSLVATALSQAVFIVTFGLLGTGPATATVLSFFAGAVPNYVLNRKWAWRTRGRVTAGELVRYCAIVVVTTIVATLATTFADDWVRSQVTSQGLRTGLVDLAYLVAYGVMFIVKYALFDGMVFNRRAHRAAPDAPTP